MTVHSTEGSRNPRLQIANVNKAFAGVTVLKNVSLSADAGEIVALLGANGAGKSTLMKILSGVYTLDSGQIRIDDTARNIATPQDAVASGIRLMPQELSVHPDLSVAENIALGSMPKRRFLGIPMIDRVAVDAQARALLKRLRLDHIEPGRRMGSLPLSEQRIVEIARALAGKAQILIMDEPTASLSEADADNLFDVIEALKDQGVTIIYISHYLDEVFRLSNRIVVLRDGEVRGEFETRDTSRDEVLTTMLGSELGDLYPVKSKVLQDAKTVLSVDGLSLPGWLDGVSFTVRRGEVFGVFSLIGSGAEKMGRAIYGAEPGARAKAIQLNDIDIGLSGPRKRVRSGIGFVAAERKRQGLIGNLSVRTNTTLPYLGLFTQSGVVDRKREDDSTREWIKTLGIKTSGPDQEIRLLSGGNQQKICLARWLLGNPNFLILEEPTRGVDLGARREIYMEIRRLAEAGLAILIVSSDAEEVAGLADRSLVLEDGKVVAELGQDATATDLMRAAEPRAALRDTNELEKT
ncbi:sugar ABC transporter ATP-binding protein [Rhizobium ruizarguesonis]|uniref:sugar ABC transporter ATP-binding protein n=1 Tax=Rhizobium ruizarguesonis TaxID=2081791 RepID=UPI001CF1F7AC|nr:sugar ABC transporter ATP-binding protein [Rhizobium ruizarguesonis]MCB2403433.1 sugar ABC transporter ATP-binding protein [Rhizobium ruizarguesonis]